MFETISPRHLTAVGLLALVPTVGYAVGRPSTVSFVAALNVVLIVASLAVATGPAATDGGSPGHGSNDGAAT